MKDPGAADDLIRKKKLEILRRINRDVSSSPDPFAHLGLVAENLAEQVAILSVRITIMEELMLAEHQDVDDNCVKVLDNPIYRIRAINSVVVPPKVIRPPSLFAKIFLGKKKYKFSLDIFSENLIQGWAWKIGYPDHACKIEFRFKEEIVAEAIADTYRLDLQEVNIGNGRHGFSFNPSLQDTSQYAEGLDVYIDGKKVSEKPILLTDE